MSTIQPNNPFLIAGYYGPDYFCDRQQETGQIINALYNERNLTLVAPRRMGKTGLIKHVFHKLHEQQPDIITLYLDIYSTQNLNEFVQVFASTVLGSVSIDIATDKEEATLKEICNYLQSSEKRCYIAIDEFQQITEYPEKGWKPCYVLTSSFYLMSVLFLPAVNSMLCRKCFCRPNVLFIKVRRQ